MTPYSDAEDDEGFWHYASGGSIYTLLANEKVEYGEITDGAPPCYDVSEFSIDLQYD